MNNEQATLRKHHEKTVVFENSLKWVYFHVLISLSMRSFNFSTLMTNRDKLKWSLIVSAITCCENDGAWTEMCENIRKKSVFEIKKVLDSAVK